MSDLNAMQGADGVTNAGVGATADAAPSSTELAFPTDAGAAPVGGVRFGCACGGGCRLDAIRRDRERADGWYDRRSR
ncbi:Uncharacterised protein [Burkholderia pseudomallei]|uniref:hypothetical protein n=1 Tax=Burkholderia pseudomallei TaxID=28450 RepID=UPI0005DD7B2E|nr:hypothetical protein [Burkholderia pseudomallei]MCE2035812.1 hypothetical protein [Burkholderia pseudomallei CS]MCE2041820.1 hypothetical protein [Burkholderia pseudomallei CB]OAG64932.1 hypothetical protein BIM11_5779 [Burkholderia pseudomallei]QFS13055.1 hypothetical protein H10_33185 [Burkholderia pseudomallei]CPG02869.1 Uncharacterised protein [Burkholderia pseudomallei]